MQTLEAWSRPERAIERARLKQTEAPRGVIVTVDYWPNGEPYGYRVRSFDLNVAEDRRRVIPVGYVEPLNRTVGIFHATRLVDLSRPPAPEPAGDLVAEYKARRRRRRAA